MQLRPVDSSGRISDQHSVAGHGEPLVYERLCAVPDRRKTSHRASCSSLRPTGSASSASARPLERGEAYCPSAFHGLALMAKSASLKSKTSRPSGLPVHCLLLGSGSWMCVALRRLQPRSGSRSACPGMSSRGLAPPATGGWRVWTLRSRTGSRTRSSVRCSEPNPLLG